LDLRPPLLENDEPLTDDDDDVEEEGVLLFLTMPPLLRPLVVPQKPWAAWTVLDPASSSVETTSEVSSDGGETGAARAKDD